MYSESDIDGAVAAGVLSPDQAAAFRNFTASGRYAPAVDEEHFKLLTGFNDIFVAIALSLSLAAIAQIGGMVTPALGGAGVAVSAWLLAEFFTRRRRMALPSILLLLAFVGGVAATMIGGLVSLQPDLPDRTDAVIGAGIALVTAGAAWAHWRRFMVPITVAAGALSLVGMVIALTLAAVPAAKDAIYPITLAAGVAVFLVAMGWDMSDKERRTRRSDVAFWLHLAAAPLIAHPVFQLLGVFNQDVDIAKAGIVLGLYLIFAFVALAIDRRALLVSSLVYVLYAMYALFQSAGAVELSASLTAFVIGSALLTLSVFWHQMRGFVVSLLGGLRNRLPPVQTMVPA
ncbi:MAG: hypothetical protein B7Y43_14590 [Sphingomonas sp. 28-62-20]|uniref:hypothetical protein n=1 Tax=unclassified Sphingomonas TaxID=196159 RepID=UPI000BCAB3C0|nr:hypothetical protein [Sphingomonas sp.]OYY76524.1 MAG: hypothetical protein B7Y43_14590 [Sphingomonas sp. 28-62-20]